MAKWLSREPRLNFNSLQKYLDPDDDPSNDTFIHRQVHHWYRKILNVERHDEMDFSPRIRHELIRRSQPQSGYGSLNTKKKHTIPI